MPREFPRSRRVEEAIQRVLSEALAARVRDPRLVGVVVTHVTVSRDLSTASVLYTLLSGERPGPDQAEALRSAAGFLRTAVARELRVRHVPELRFKADEGLFRGRILADLIDSAVAGSDKGGDHTPPKDGTQ